ncbi:MAG: DNA cytosine methyltransferase [Brevinema sp.]
MKAIDLFCGIGGFHYACQENGIPVVWASEIDKYARQQYKLNHGLSPYGDVTAISENEIPKHDLLCAGFPCQPFSTAGRKQGFEDIRGTLFYEIVRILEYHKTAYFILENVPNLLSHEQGRTIDTILSAFQDLGYFIKVTILNAAEFGLAQVRRRVFMVGFRNREEYFRFQFPSPYGYKVSLKEILEREVEEKYFIKNPSLFQYINKKQKGIFKNCPVNPEQAHTLLARQYGSWNGNYIAEPFLGRGTQRQRVFDTDNLYCSLTRNAEFIVDRVAQNNKGNQGYRVYNSEENAISLTAQGYSKTGLYSIEDRIRKLTPRECARLQGFPEEYQIECSDNQAYKQFGNAVPVPVVSAIIKQLLKVINNKE